MVAQSEKFTEAIVSLYHLISSADGKISDFEKRICELMMKSEGIEVPEFEMIINTIDQLSQDEIYAKSIDLLKSCTKDEQIKAMAWMRGIANSDGFMAKEEWSLIFKIYKKELNLNLKDIIEYKLPLFINVPG